MARRNGRGARRRYITRRNKNAFASARTFNLAISRMSAGKVFNFKQFITGSALSNGGGPTSSVITQTGSAQYFAWYFSLNDLPQVSSFTALFDQFRINKVKLRFMPMAQQVAGGTLVPSNAGIFGTVLDYDDANALSSLNAYEQYENFKFQACASSKVHSRTIIPHIAVATYSGTFAGYGNTKPMWLDTATPTVQHYGIKVFLAPNSVSSQYQTYYVQATYWVSFKNLR